VEFNTFGTGHFVGAFEALTISGYIILSFSTISQNFDDNFRNGSPFLSKTSAVAYWYMKQNILSVLI
jgi:hypothetical protein